MAEKQNGSPAVESEMSFREKRELQHQEGTRAGVYFEPSVDIYETEDSLTLVADVPRARPMWMSAGSPSTASTGWATTCGSSGWVSRLTNRGSPPGSRTASLR
jgi:hypothetical protein